MRSVTVQKALERYRKTVSILKKGYAQETWRIAQLSRSFLGNLPVREVTSKDIASYRDQRLAAINPRTRKPLSPSSVRLEMSLLSSFFDLCRIEWGYCKDNPCSNVRKPKPAPARDRRFTTREARQILDYAQTHPNPAFLSIVILALETAMRQGEILHLRWENVNLQKRIAHLPETKNGSKRDIPLSLKARDAILRMKKLPGENTGTQGKIFDYTPSGFKTTWRVMRERLGIQNLRFHDARHEAVSRLFELGPARHHGSGRHFRA